jgi:hypothetical protein
MLAGLFGSLGSVADIFRLTKQTLALHQLEVLTGLEDKGFQIVLALV